MTPEELKAIQEKKKEPVFSEEEMSKAQRSIEDLYDRFKGQMYDPTNLYRGIMVMLMRIEMLLSEGGHENIRVVHHGQSLDDERIEKIFGDDQDLERGVIVERWMERYGGTIRPIDRKIAQLTDKGTLTKVGRGVYRLQKV